MFSNLLTRSSVGEHTCFGFFPQWKIQLNSLSEILCQFCSPESCESSGLPTFLPTLCGIGLILVTLVGVQWHPVALFVLRLPTGREDAPRYCPLKAFGVIRLEFTICFLMDVHTVLVTYWKDPLFPTVLQQSLYHQPGGVPNGALCSEPLSLGPGPPAVMTFVL